MHGRPPGYHTIIGQACQARVCSQVISVNSELLEYQRRTGVINLLNYPSDCTLHSSSHHTQHTVVYVSHTLNGQPANKQLLARIST